MRAAAIVKLKVLLDTSRPMRKRNHCRMIAAKDGCVTEHI